MYLSEDFRIKVGLAEMFKGGVIMDVTNAEQAKIAEQAGAVSVMALERVPADIRKEGGVARMASIAKVRQIMETVSIPVMAKVRIGHFAEAHVLEALKVDYIDESEVLTPADEEHHIDKTRFKVPFVCGARNLGEALRRIAEGAAMIRTKGEAGSGNVVEAVRHMRAIQREMKRLTVTPKEELAAAAKQLQAPLELVEYVAENAKLPTPNFSAGGDRHAGRCGAGDAPWRRSLLRRLGNLQVGRSRAARASHRPGDHLLQRPGPTTESQRGTGRADAGPRCLQAARRGTASDPWLVTVCPGRREGVRGSASYRYRATSARMPEFWRR